MQNSVVCSPQLKIGPLDVHSFPVLHETRIMFPLTLSNDVHDLIQRVIDGATCFLVRLNIILASTLPVLLESSGITINVMKKTIN
jgi:hypothetical protein